MFINLQENAKKRRVIFKRAEDYIREYKKRERDTVRLHRQARKHGNFYVEDEPRLAFVIRIRGWVNLILNGLNF